MKARRWTQKDQRKSAPQITENQREKVGKGFTQISADEGTQMDAERSAKISALNQRKSARKKKERASRR